MICHILFYNFPHFVIINNTLQFPESAKELCAQFMHTHVQMDGDKKMQKIPPRPLHKGINDKEAQSSEGVSVSSL